MATIAPFGKYRAFDENGAPLSGGKLYTYEAGTSTPKATYTSSTLGTANTNPVTLDADGYANVWLDVGGYKFVLDDANDVNQFTVDGINGGSAVGFASSVVSRSSSFSLGVNEQNVVNICASPLTVSLLPVATAGNGFTSVIVNLSGGNVTVDPDGSETINNVGSLVIGNGNSLNLSCDGLEWYAFGYTQTELSDSVFRVVDNADETKKLAFEVSGVTTATTRTVTVQNVNGTMYVSTGTDVAIADGGTGASDAATAFSNLKQDATTTATGVVELATTAEVKAGSDAVRAITPSTLKSGAGFSNYFASSNQTITGGGSLTIAHGLTRIPVLMQSEIVCVTGEGGYTAGDVVPVSTTPNNAATAGGASIVYDGTNINVRFGTSANVFYINNKTTGNTFGITPANWQYRVKAWA